MLCYDLEIFLLLTMGQLCFLFVASTDCIQLGFLPRSVAKWVSPLWDMGFFEFHGYLYREDALTGVTATFGGSNKKVQLILHVSQAWYFCYLFQMLSSCYTACC